MESDMATVSNAIYLCNAMVLFMCVAGTLALFRKWSGRRACVYLGIALILWSIPYAFILVRLLALDPVGGTPCVLPVEGITGYVFFSMILLPYPLEIVNPGWLTWGRLFRRISPVLAVLALMWIAWCEAPVTFDSASGIPGRVFSFSVWTRLLMIPMPFIYLVWTAYEVLKVDRRWQKWSRERGVSTPKTTGWLQFYFAGMGLMCLSYVFVIFNETPASFLVFDIITVVFLSYLVYKALFTDLAYPESFYCSTENGGFRAEEIDTAFAAKIPGYKRMIEEWFERERPYLDSHFKLESVKTLVPLNRTYISRIFNEGFGMGFSDYIRTLRMQEARRLLAEEPDLGIGEIAERCGFSTHSSFHRSFMQNNEGLTPGEYRQHMLTKK